VGGLLLLAGVDLCEFAGLAGSRVLLASSVSAISSPTWVDEGADERASLLPFLNAAATPSVPSSLGWRGDLTTAGLPAKGFSASSISGFPVCSREAPALATDFPLAYDGGYTAPFRSPVPLLIGTAAAEGLEFSPILGLLPFAVLESRCQNLKNFEY